MNTVGDFIKSGSIDIVPILTLVLRKSVASLISHSDYQLNNIEITKLNELVDKRAKGVPFAYLNNKKGFYHLEFIVTEATLIPRPETELLV
ncbi:MAG TPA: peptide chain release factor N(5)-glutamine methyltransferase, partial [Gammaproteobacteria bacterium]|nr:peptide chain release factor N(5)-glutamine methyltransferase [Gammaproteobacteria bacterium]